MIGLDTNEVKVFKKLSLNPQSVAELVRILKMPRMTVYTNLLRLKQKKLVKEVKSETGKRMLWVKNDDSVIESELSRVAETMLGGAISAGPGITTYRGKEEVSDALMDLTVRKDGARMYSIQSSKNWATWIKLMGKEWVNKHNRAVVKHKLLALTIHSPEAPDDIKKDKDITDAYKGRLGNSHAIPEEFLPKGLSLYIFEDTILLVDLQKVEAISFTNHNMATFLIKMFTFMFEQSEREEFFQKFGR
jgi:hypothetical protein